MRTITAAMMVGLAACGPTSEEPCQVGDAQYAAGDVWASEDGCVHYLCEDGEAIVDPTEEGARAIAGDVVVTTQAEVDALACTMEIGGSLRITGSAADFGELRYLAQIGGDLVIEASAAADFNGLGALAEIDGDLLLADNQQLLSMSLPRAMSVYGDFTLRNNDALQTMEGAGFLGGCSSCAAPPEQGVSWRDQDPAGFGGEEIPGGTFHGNILITENDALVNLGGLADLVYAWADFRLRGNAKLARLTDLRLGDVRGALEISNHPQMDPIDVELFTDQVTVGGGVLTCGNGDQPSC